RRGADLGGAVARNHARRRLRVGECHFNVEERLQKGLTAEWRHQISKNTVSFSPCTTISKRNSLGLCDLAIKVWRRDSGTAASTASSLFAGSSAKYTRDMYCVRMPRASTRRARCGACVPPPAVIAGGLTVSIANPPSDAVSDRNTSCNEGCHHSSTPSGMPFPAPSSK